MFLPVYSKSENFLQKNQLSNTKKLKNDWISAICVFIFAKKWIFSPTFASFFCEHEEQFQ